MGQVWPDGDPTRGRPVAAGSVGDWLTTLGALRARGFGGVLVTVVEVEGSAPREAGAKMVVTAEGVHGSIGGGRLELEAITAARTMLDTVAAPALRRIALGPSLGQCCGGAVVLLFEVTSACDWSNAVATNLRRGRPSVAVTMLAAPATSRVPLGAKLIVTESDVAGSWGAPALEAGALRAARNLLAVPAARAETTVVLGHRLLLDRLAPKLEVVLFGAGHVGRALVAILATLPCAVTWIDERARQYPPILPRNVRAEPSDEPEGEVAAAPSGACFVVMTHSHQRDLAIAERVLRRGDFAYLGMIGSTSKRRRFEQRLCARGLEPARIARLRCPIGLAGIPGKHPGAIAVAVAAELLQTCGGALVGARAW